ncbi:MAG: hypothetical protein U0556_12425 [Dehalococcoidia bacterium]
MDQIFQLAGALLILVAFVGAQTGRLAVRSLRSILLNLVGSAVLAIVALIGSNWGFFLLETVWAGVSAGSLIQMLRGRRTA